MFKNSRKTTTRGGVTDDTMKSITIKPGKASRTEDRMRGLYVATVLLTLCFATGSAAVGIDASAVEDTVMKIKYTGGSPNGDHPAVTVEGKKIGLHSKANNTSGARGLTGSVGSITTLYAGSSQIGVVGLSSMVGIYGQGPDVGVRGSSSYHGIGVSGDAPGGYGVGVRGNGKVFGVEGITDDEYGYGVYGRVEEDGVYAGYFEGDVYVDGDLGWSSSDEALKQNIRSLEKGLNVILALQPKAYEIKAGVTRVKPSPGTKFGLIAQDVLPVLPEIVKDVKRPAMRKPDGSWQTVSERAEIKSVNYMALIPVLIKGMQEQQAQIEALKQEVQQLRGR
jgi:hypothetical protein